MATVGEEDVVEIGDHNVLVLGSGAREHAIAWKLNASPQVEQVYIAPGNAGTTTENLLNVELDISQHDVVVSWCKENDISLVVVGPEKPLADGIANKLNKMGVACFGPSPEAAQLEASKVFAKNFMDEHEIPTARWKSFTDASEAEQFIKSAPYKAHVVKASGLAAGKGVVVAANDDEACKAVREALLDKRFGDAGNTVVVEELLTGTEISCLAFTDGKCIACFPPAQDYKRLELGDLGANTGGMGAFSPVPYVSFSQMQNIKETILQKTVDGMRKDGTPFVGVLYAGLMINEETGDIRVLEFNCRFGDPEAQVLLSLLSPHCDLFGLMLSCAQGNLDSAKLDVDPNKWAVCVVCASAGYPGKYDTGKPITDLELIGRTARVFHAGTRLAEGALVTAGGRVLSLVSVSRDIASAVDGARDAAEMVQYEGKVFRDDIARRAVEWMRSVFYQREIRSESQSRTNGRNEEFVDLLGTNLLTDLVNDRAHFMRMQRLQGLRYNACGVNIANGEDLVKSIKPLAKSSEVPGCMGELGGFGGFFDPKAAGFADPVLVSGTDGVGTKLKIAQELGEHGSVGMDLVAMCVNDILCHGAQPLFFLDYLATARLNVASAKAIVSGIVDGCKQAKCALLGGETAEVPGMYEPGVYDLAGFAVGAVERNAQLPNRQAMTTDDVIIGLASSGVHSNGFSMVRTIVDMSGFDYDMVCPWDSSKKMGDALLTPTAIYVEAVLPLMRAGQVKGAAHITGGGLRGNLPRILPDSLNATLDAARWPVLPVFKWIASEGEVSCAEMARTFNLGLGMALVVGGEQADSVRQTLQQAGVQAYVVGRLTHNTGKERVVIENLESALELAEAGSEIKRRRTEVQEDGDRRRCKVAVLISGTGTNLQALIDHTRDPANKSQAQIVLVISNRKDVQGLKRAEAANIPVKVIEHTQYPVREQFDDAIHRELESAGVELVCLAGFMRILSGKLVRRWRGRLVNIHPSLLPAFKGLKPHKQVLAAGVTVTGCSVHFVEEEVDAGAILVQETVAVDPSDDVDDIELKVKQLEHVAYPKALELLASGRAKLGEDGRVSWSKTTPASAQNTNGDEAAMQTS